LSSAAVSFQFRGYDGRVPQERADGLFAAAKAPKEKKVYAAGHALNPEAAMDRKEWLK